MTALFIFFLFSAFAAFCGLLIYGYRSRAHSAEARANRAEGALEVSQHNLGVVAEIARECVKGIGLNPKEIVPDEVLPQRDRSHLPADYGTREGIGTLRCSCGYAEIRMTGGTRERCPKCGKSNSNYTPQTVAFCLNCNVSVRHDPSDYPVKCPACKTLIDPVLDNPPEFDTA